MQRKARIGSDRLVVIPNAVDVDRFAQATPVPRHELDIPVDSFILLFVGRLEPQKLPDTLIELVDVLARNWSLYAHSSVSAFASVHLVFAGEGPLRNRLEADVAKREALRGRVHFLGQRSDIPRLLKTANVLVLPSQWEGMPNVILEAMAAGTPVIARDLPEIRELIDDGRTGDLVPHNNADDPAMWRLPILKLLGHPDRVSLQVNAAQEYVRNHHSPVSMVRAYERLWTAVLASGQHRIGYRRGP
jgi:glycosyltransferase involved in cell wall biosynthesis